MILHQDNMYVIDFSVSIITTIYKLFVDRLSTFIILNFVSLTVDCLKMMALAGLRYNRAVGSNLILARPSPTVCDHTHLED